MYAYLAIVIRRTQFLMFKMYQNLNPIYLNFKRILNNWNRVQYIKQGVIWLICNLKYKNNYNSSNNNNLI